MDIHPPLTASNGRRQSLERSRSLGLLASLVATKPKLPAQLLNRILPLHIAKPPQQGSQIAIQLPSALSAWRISLINSPDSNPSNSARCTSTQPRARSPAPGRLEWHFPW